MKNLLRLAIGGSIALSMGAVAFGQHYTQVNLVSNISGEAPTTDTSLVDAWGISRTVTSAWWVDNAITGVSTLYNGAGVKNSLVVTIPPNLLKKISKTGLPSGTISNTSTTDFILSNGLPAEFLFATLDGTIAAWNSTIGLPPGAAGSSTRAVTVISTKDGSAYTGFTSSTVEQARFLYAANFSLGRIDVYDNSFHLVHLNGDHPTSENTSFVDPNLPNNYAPFNVQAIGNNIVVTYATKDSTGRAQGGPGLGYVDIYSSAGQLLLRLDHGDQLNAPWGVALAPNDFGDASHELLIGQFAGAGTTENSGTIAAYDITTGHFLGQLKNAAGAPIAINGLWSLSFGNATSTGDYDPAGAPGAQMYFSAGPKSESQGLFGYLKPVASDLIDGNDQ